MSSKLRSLLSVAAPIAGTLLFPGLGTALGLGAGGLGIGAEGLSAIGGGLGGAAGGAIGGGGLSGALKGAALGAGGGYLGSGGASDLLGGTSVGTALGLSSPEGGSVAGNILGSTPSPTSFSSLLGSGSSTPSASLGISSPASSGLGTGSGLTGQFASGVAGNSPAFSSLASPALSAGTGGGASSFGSLFSGGNGLNTLATLGGAANSLYANDQAQKDLLNANKNAQGAIAPYQASGLAANSRLSDLLGTSGNSTAQGFGTLGKPFTPGDLTQDPGYQFQLQQGNQALDRQQAAKGNYFSGGALKAAQDYGQGLADTTYNNAYQRYLSGQQQQYGMLSGQAGAGQQAANTSGNLFAGTGNAQAGAGISSSNILNQSLSSMLNGPGSNYALSTLLSGAGAKQPYVMPNGQVGYR